MLIFSSCTDEFLETAPSTEVSDKLIYNTTESTRGVLYGVYKYMRSWGSTGNVRMDCAGLHTNLLTFDVMGCDITMPPSTWYWYDYDYWHTSSETVFKTDHLWRFYYSIINNCNNILFYLPDVQGPESEKEAIEQEARTLRAFCYFHLVQLYQHTYVLAKDRPGVPIYLEPATGQEENNPRASVDQVYNLITADLERAVQINSYDRSSKYYINKSVSMGILARVYLTMGEWEKAASMATSARIGYPLMSMEQWGQGFNSNNNPEWIWGIHQTSDQNVGWASTFSVMDFARGDQKHFRINNLLADQYSTTDIRGSLIQPVGEYLGNRKFREPANLNTGDMVLMRTAEMYLIEAEAKARLFLDTQAQDILHELQISRDPNAIRSTLTGSDLIELILLERRKELWGEGFGLFDMLRNQKPLTRGGDHNSLKNLPANSWSFIFQIPRSEIDINKGINSEDQNPLSGVFK